MPWANRAPAAATSPNSWIPPNTTTTGLTGHAATGIAILLQEIIPTPAWAGGKMPPANHRAAVILFPSLPDHLLELLLEVGDDEVAIDHLPVGIEEEHRRQR